MAFRSSVPRTTHTWLKPLYDYLDDGVSVVVPSGNTGVANAIWAGSAVPYTQLGNASGKVGIYGSTGIAGQLATGTAGITGVTGAGGMTAFSVVWINGGTGSYYTLSDIVTALKNVGVLKP